MTPPIGRATCLSPLSPLSAAMDIKLRAAEGGKAEEEFKRDGGSLAPPSLLKDSSLLLRFPRWAIATLRQGEGEG